MLGCPHPAHAVPAPPSIPLGTPRQERRASPQGDKSLLPTAAKQRGRADKYCMWLRRAGEAASTCAGWVITDRSLGLTRKLLGAGMGHVRGYPWGKAQPCWRAGKFGQNRRRCNGQSGNKTCEPCWLQPGEESPGRTRDSPIKGAQEVVTGLWGLLLTSAVGSGTWTRQDTPVTCPPPPSLEQSSLWGDTLRHSSGSGAILAPHHEARRAGGAVALPHPGDKAGQCPWGHEHRAEPPDLKGERKC